MTVALVLPGWGTSVTRLDAMCAGLREAGVDARAHGYSATGSIDAIGSALAEIVATHAQSGPVHLVGHSLGGLASASAVLEHGAQVATVTTINTPWRGTWVAWTADPHDPLGHELRWRSPRLQTLRRSLATHLATDADGPHWTLLAAAVDLAATPATSLRVASGRRLETDVVGVTGHSLSLMKPAMIARVVRAVAGDPGTADAEASRAR